MSDKQSITRGIAVFASGTFVSRLAGFVRDTLCAGMLGTNLYGMFLLSFRIPHALRSLFAEGAANSAVVPVVSDYLETRTKEETDRTIASLFGATIIILGTVTLLGVLAMPWIVAASTRLSLITKGEGLSGGEFISIISLTRTLFPYIFLIGIATVGAGILYSHRHFAAPACSPIVLNIVLISSIFLFAPDPHVLARAVLVGGGVQVLLIAVVLHAKGVKLLPRLDLKDAGLRMIGRLWMPVVLGQAAWQANMLLDSLLVLSLGVRFPVWLMFSQNLINVPLGIFGVAIANSVLPEMSRYAATDRLDGLRQTYAYGMRLVLFVCIPAAVGFIALAEPIVRMLFQHHEFMAVDTRQTAFSLRFYAIGLACFAGVKITAGAFYALKETKLPVKISVSCISINVVFNLLLIRYLQHGGLALASSISATVNISLLLYFLRKRLGRINGGEILSSALRILAASAAMAVVCRALYAGFDKFLPERGFALHGVGVFIIVCLGVVTYWSAGILLKTRELGELKQLFLRKA
ncbi:murein biosynthesis integral membrane protein MurJ [Candidatus Hydrogenedentota bacterium]